MYVHILISPGIDNQSAKNMLELSLTQYVATAKPTIKQARYETCRQSKQLITYCYGLVKTMPQIEANSAFKKFSIFKIMSDTRAFFVKMVKRFCLLNFKT